MWHEKINELYMPQWIFIGNSYSIYFSNSNLFRFRRLRSCNKPTDVAIWKSKQRSDGHVSYIKRCPFKIFSIRIVCETESPSCIFRKRKQIEPRRYLFSALIFTHTSCLNISELSVDWDEIGFAPVQTTAISHIFSYRFQLRALDC